MEDKVYTSVITGSNGISIEDPLSDEGKKQAEGLGERLWKSNPELNEIHSSNLARCKQTAELVKQVFHDHGKKIEVIIHPELREIEHGSMDGKINGSVRNMIYEEYYKEKMRDLQVIDPDLKHNSNPPGFDGENYKAVHERAKKIFYEIAEKYAQPIVLISSSAFIKTLIIDSMHRKEPFDPCKPMFYENIGTGTNTLKNAEGYRFAVDVEKQEIKYLGVIQQN